MGKYRKKPVVIEAVQLTTAEPNEPLWREKPPQWLVDAVRSGTVEAFSNFESDWVFLRIKTLEGDMVAEPGDYIIRGINGEIYPCKPDIFEQTYEPVENDE